MRELQRAEQARGPESPSGRDADGGCHWRSQKSCISLGGVECHEREPDARFLCGGTCIVDGGFPHAIDDVRKPWRAVRGPRQIQNGGHRCRRGVNAGFRQA